jgi:cytochrome c553
VTTRFKLALLSTALLTVSTGTVHAQSAETAPDTMAARVLACASCHGDKGQGTNDDYFPRLAGKPSGYLYNQLVAFRDGRRKYPPMNYLLEFLPDPYLKAMADYFASEQPPFPPPVTPTVSNDILARGEMLATKGDASHEIPACANCHGPSFTGMEPAIPGLLGLRTNYISAQLGAWRYGTRTASVPDCMQIVCRASDRGRRQGACRLAFVAPDGRKPRARGARLIADAAVVRQRTELRGEQ